MPVYKGTPTKDGRIYYFVDWKKDINGNNKQYKSKKYLTKKEAENEEHLFMLKKNNPYKKEFGLIAKDYFKYLETITKPKTIYNYKCDYKNHIMPYFEQKDINSINIQEIDKWALELKKKGLSVVFKNKIYNILNNIMNYAMKYYGLETNCVHIYGRFKNKNDEVVKDKQKLRYITYEEFNKFVECVDDYVYKTFFYFAYYTGCRKGEMFALTWEDVDFKNKVIHISQTLDEHTKDSDGNILITNTKTRKNRNISISKILFDKLIEYKEKMKEYKDFKETWFVFGNSTHLSGTNIDRAKDKAFELSGIHRITLHEFRHSHVSLLINEYVKQSKEKNMKIDTAKFFLMMSERMGHTIDVMQRTYLHLFPTIQDEIIDLLDNL